MYYNHTQVTTGIAEVAPLQCALSEAATFGQAEVVKALPDPTSGYPKPCAA